MLRPAFALSILACLPACFDSEKEEELVDRHYEVPFLTDDECAQADPLFNCSADLSLCADGSMTIIVTDIINGGTYFRSGDQFVATVGAGDVPDEIVFTLHEDGTLEDDFTDWTWMEVDSGLCPND